jgi:hypothetical protein
MKLFLKKEATGRVNNYIKAMNPLDSPHGKTADFFPVIKECHSIMQISRTPATNRGI